MSNLTIKDIKARAVIAPLVRPVTTAVGTIPAAPLVLVDVICDHDIVGHAYLFGYTPLSLRPLIEIIANLKEMLVGQPLSPVKLKNDMDDKFRLLGRQGFLGMAMAGLDMAFWDALGKNANMPVAMMLGGNSDAIACYDSYGIFDRKTSEKQLQQSLNSGFKAIKIKIGGGNLQVDIDAVRAARDILGSDVKLMVDYNQSLSAPEAIWRIRHLAEFDLHWVEEPVPAEDFAGHVAVRAASEVPIQTGENWWFPEDAARAIAAGISDFAMLDVMKIGGITGWMQAAAIADAAALPVSSHLFVEASAHVMAVTPRAHLLEYLDISSTILADPYEIVDGKLTPRGPGLGIEWNMSALKKYSV